MLIHLEWMANRERGRNRPKQAKIQLSIKTNFKGDLSVVEERGFFL